VVVGLTVCEMCRGSKEMAQHSFLECSIAEQVWSPCFRWSGILFVQNKDLKTHFENIHLVQI